MIVDTSALMAILLDEPEGHAFTLALVDAHRTRMSAATLVEANIVAGKRGVARELSALIERVGIEIVPVDDAQAKLAVEGFERFGKGRHEAGLNYGDLFSYALARSLREPLLFKGADFSKTDVMVAV